MATSKHLNQLNICLSSDLQCLLGEPAQHLVEDVVVALIPVHVHQSRLLEQEVVRPCPDQVPLGVVLQLDVLAEATAVA